MALTSFQTDEAISAGNLVFLTSTGLIKKAIATVKEQASVIGVALDSGTTGNLIRVNTDAIYSNFSALTPGNVQYLSIASSGSLVDYPSWQTQLNALSASGAFLTQVGRAISTTSVEIEISKPIYVIK
jgi:arabinogalactan endo-1,4-beta-galactosidase